MSKPHLRLHYKPQTITSCGGTFEPYTAYVWSVELVRDDRMDPSKRARRETFLHQTALGACRSALTLWWPEWAQRAYG